MSHSHRRSRLHRSTPLRRHRRRLLRTVRIVRFRAVVVRLELALDTCE